MGHDMSNHGRSERVNHVPTNTGEGWGWLLVLLLFSATMATVSIVSWLQP